MTEEEAPSGRELARWIRRISVKALENGRLIDGAVGGFLSFLVEAMADETEKRTVEPPSPGWAPKAGPIVRLNCDSCGTILEWIEGTYPKLDRFFFLAHKGHVLRVSPAPLEEAKPIGHDPAQE